MSAAAARQPSAAEVEAAMGVLYRSEPSASVDLWKRSFDTLSTALDRARSVRNTTRLCVIAVISVAAIALVFLLAPAISVAQVTEQARLTPLMTEGHWAPPELQYFLLAIAFGCMAVEYALSRVFPVLGREEAIVNLLRYYGSKVQLEETPQ